MTRENVAITKSIYEAFARADIPAVLAAFSPDIAWHTPRTLPWSRGDYRGHEGVIEYFTSFAASLLEPRIEPDEFIAEGDRVIGHGYERGRARTTGVAFEAEFAHLWTLKDGMVVRMEGIVDTATIQRAFERDSAPTNP